MVSQPSNMVTHRGESCRKLMVPHSLSMVLSSWKVGAYLQQNEQRDCWPCQLVHCILNETMDGQSILSLISFFFLDRVRSGWFDVICLLSAAATWSRARHFGDGQQPLRSRAEPFGLQSLDPFQFRRLRHRTSSWNLFLGSSRKRSCARQKKVGVILVFPEDLGGLLDSGPTSIWALQEFANHSKAYKVVSVVQRTSARL